MDHPVDDAIPYYFIAACCLVFVYNSTGFSSTTVRLREALHEQVCVILTAAYTTLEQSFLKLVSPLPL